MTAQHLVRRDSLRKLASSNHSLRGVEVGSVIGGQLYIQDEAGSSAHRISLRVNSIRQDKVSDTQKISAGRFSAVVVSADKEWIKLGARPGDTLNFGRAACCGEWVCTDKKRVMIGVVFSGSSFMLVPRRSLWSEQLTNFSVPSDAGPVSLIPVEF